MRERILGVTAGCAGLRCRRGKGREIGGCSWRGRGTGDAAKLERERDD